MRSTKIIETEPSQCLSAPWGDPVAFSVGGLESVGFDSETELLLVGSSRGRGVFDCDSCSRVFRDNRLWSEENNYEDQYLLEMDGVGPLAGKRIRTSGINGGGLASGTSDGWSVQSFNGFNEEEILVLFENWESTFCRVQTGAGELRAFGFSPSGKVLVLATSADLTIWTR